VSDEFELVLDVGGMGMLDGRDDDEDMGEEGGYSAETFQLV
jgi:hypothetical protein